jgi:hypothetical protein
MKNAYKVLVGRTEGKSQLEDLDVDGKVILETVLGNRVRMCGLDSSDLEEGPVASFFEHVNETSNSIKGEESRLFQ